MKDLSPYTEHWFGDALACENYGYLGPDLDKANFGRRYYLFVKNNVKNVALEVFGEEGVKLKNIWIEQ